jgi:hypothetical protein
MQPPDITSASNLMSSPARELRGGVEQVLVAQVREEHEALATSRDHARLLDSLWRRNMEDRGTHGDTATMLGN